MTSLTGLDFDAAYTQRTLVSVDDVDVPFIGPGDLRINKLATGRAQDLADVEHLPAD